MTTITDFLPNPLDKNASLNSVNKKAAQLKTVASYPQLIRNMLFLSVVSVVAILKFNLSPFFYLVIATEVIVQLIYGYILSKQYKETSALPSDANGIAFKELITTNQKYLLLRSTVKAINSIVIAGLALILSPKFLDTTNNIPHMPFTALLSIKSILYIWVGTRLTEVLGQVVQFLLVKNLKMTDDYAQNLKAYLIYDEKISLLRYVPGAILLLTIFALMGIPLYIIAIFGSFFLLMTILSVIEIKRLQSPNPQIPQFIENHINQTKSAETAGLNKVSMYPDEKIVSVVYGVLRSAADFKDIFRTSGFSILGSGKSYNPENTLVLTNHRALLVQISVTGGNSIVGDTDFTLQNILFNRQEIRQNGEKFLNQTPLEQLIKNSMHDLPFEQIKHLLINKMSINIELVNNMKYKYAFFDQEYIQYLQSALSQLPVNNPLS